MPISEATLKDLCCPKCRGDLVLKESPEGLACLSCGLLYPIRDGIPIMLTSEALPLAPDELK